MLAFAAESLTLATQASRLTTAMSRPHFYSYSFPTYKNAGKLLVHVTGGREEKAYAS
jgi:hypothetical protein